MFRIRVDNDGNLATTNDQSWLVFEHGAVGPYTAPQAFTVPNCLRDGQQRCVGGADGGSVLISP